MSEAQHDCIQIDMAQKPVIDDKSTTQTSTGDEQDNPRSAIRAEEQPSISTEQLATELDKTTLRNGRKTPPAELKELPASPPPPEPPAESEKPYLDPTPKTPTFSRKPSHQNSELDYDEKEGKLPQLSTTTPKASRIAQDEDNESTAEIQSIMDQFAEGAAAPTKEEIMSPKHEPSDPMQGAGGAFTPRKSSLERLTSRDMDAIANSPVADRSEKFEPFPASPPPVPPKPEVASVKSPPASIRNISVSLPVPEPEPELPFDFHRFLEQLRHKSADPVARFLRSFLGEFGKKQWMVHEQVKLIGDFLAFITNKMAQCDVWREVSDNEFENAKEGMEKLVMNRLYSQTFSPAIPPPPHIPRSSSRSKKKDLEKVLGPGRKGQHQEDVERDEILAQKIRIYSWVKEDHLDIPAVGPNGERFLRLAQQELAKIRNYRAPRDKVICILNCCKVIFGLLKNAQSSDTSADSFVPLLIYVVLQANPEHLVSNIQYILRFRNSDKLSGEAGYYLSSLSGAIQFIEGLDRTTLTVSDDEFERNVEAAVANIAAQNREEPASPPQQYSEKAALAEAELTPRNSSEYTPRRSLSASGPSTRSEESAASDDPVGGLLRTIQKPLSSIGRFLSDTDTTDTVKNTAPALPPRSSTEQGRVQQYDAQEAAARQASAEAAEARKIQRAEHRTVVDTLCGMFPNLDREVIDDVVRQKQGRVGLAVDACLALTAGT